MVTLTPLTLVNQVDPTGHRLFTTTVADGQGAFVLQFNNGQVPVGSGELTAADAATAPDVTASDMQFTAHCPLPTAHYLEDNAHYLDLALGELGLTPGGVPVTALGQPTPILNTELGEQELDSANMATSLVQTDGVPQTDWTSDIDLAYLRQSVKHFVLAPELGGLDGRGSEDSD